MILTLSLTLLLASSLAAADRQKKGKGKKGRAQRKPTVIRFLPDEVKESLTDEQKEEVAKLDKEFGPKLAELEKKRRSILTPEQIKAQTEARKAATEAGKKGKEMFAAIAAALKLSDEQKKEMDAHKKENDALQKVVREKVLALLTDDQKAKIPKRGAGKKSQTKGAGKGKRAKKKAE